MGVGLEARRPKRLDSQGNAVQNGLHAQPTEKSVAPAGGGRSLRCDFVGARELAGSGAALGRPRGELRHDGIVLADWTPDC